MSTLSLVPQETISQEKMNEIIEDLRGTCSFLEFILEEHGIDRDLSIKECEMLDEKIMLCTCCGWWAETSEMSEDSRCEECAEDE